MAAANAEAGDAEGQPLPLDLQRPGSRERKNNLWVRSPPYIGDEKVREMEKSGLLSGLAPPSQILDGSMPLVDLEANRLQEAMTWVYDSVRALKQKGSAVEAQLTSIQEMLQQFNKASVEDRAIADVVAPTDEDTAGASSANAAMQSSAMRRMLRELESKRVASEKLIEMRIDSLKSDLDQRLQGKDLQEHKKNLTGELDTFHRKSREDIGILGGMIHTESAAERRRIHTQLEVVSNRLSKQTELTEQQMKESIERHNEATQQIEARLQAIESLGAASKLEARLAALEGSGTAVAAKGGRASGDVAGADTAKVSQLEATVVQLQAQMKELADRCESSSGDASTPAPAAGSADPPDGALQDVVRRLSYIESRVAGLDSAGGAAREGEDVHKQLVEVHRTHTEMHRQLLEVGARLELVEKSAPQAGRGGGGGADPKTVMDLAAVTARVTRLETLNDATTERLGELDQNRLAEHKLNAKAIERVQLNLETFVKYVTGESLSRSRTDSRPDSQSSDRPGDEGVEGEWPLAWLERRVEALIKKKGGASLEARLQGLEKAAAEGGSTDLSNRVKQVEQQFSVLDVTDLGRVRPDLSQHQKQQEIFGRDLLKEVNELKVILGCVEACIPRETRKAVQLFKRASGSADAVPQSPREFAMEGKILALREDLDAIKQDSNVSLESNRQQMTAVVKNLEKKQEMLASHVDDIRKGTQKA